ncbi:hypothetical protein B0H12DRAFT_1329543 [Mycena haematopus]|nr:hypothetical protein B0H12DRAFT_1329543 [Mycena haematopus]
MANILRSPKSGNDWTQKELAAYNIRVVEQSPVEFFGIERLPSLPASLYAFSRTEDRTDATTNDTYELLHHLDLAHMPKKLSVQIDVCILDSSNDILLLVQQDNGNDPEPQVNAEAIAAFQRYNFIRERQLHLPALDGMVIPAITVYGTLPTFYKLTVTASLNDAVKKGTFPGVATPVYRHVPRHSSDRMKNSDSRWILLQYLEAFKEFMVKN